MILSFMILRIFPIIRVVSSPFIHVLWIKALGPSFILFKKAATYTASFHRLFLAWMKIQYMNSHSLTNSLFEYLCFVRSTDID